MAGESYEKEQIHPWLWFRMSGVKDVDAAQAARGGFFFRTVKPGPGADAVGRGRAHRPPDRRDGSGRPDVRGGGVPPHGDGRGRAAARAGAGVRGGVPHGRRADARRHGVTPAQRRVHARPRRRGARVRRHDRVDGPLDEVRRALPHPVSQPAAATHGATCSSPAAASASTIACTTRRRRSRPPSRRARRRASPRCTRCARRRRWGGGCGSLQGALRAAGAWLPDAPGAT